MLHRTLLRYCTLHASAHYGTLHAAYALLLPRAQDEGLSSYTHHCTHHYAHP